jgi:hypothetical protein
MAELPLVLAGPVLRRVDSGRVCVWIALSKPGDVTVTVFSGRAQSTGNGTASAPSIGTRTRATRKFGVNLHAAVVDVDVAGMPPLSRHCYDVVVDAGGEVKGLKALGMLRDATAGTPKAVALGYADDFLPSFVTAAADVEDLRLVHASCRKSNGPGPDALAWLDDRIKDGLSNLDKAPQQLFLTGDQIYADDLGGVLLPMLADLAKDLVGTEQLPVGGSNLDATYERFPALRRQNVVRGLGRLTTTDGANHLLTYGEFAAMYCAAFSPSVWRPMHDPGSLFTPMPADATLTSLTDFEECFGSTDEWKEKKLIGVNDEGTRVEQWRDAVPKVARALANVPTFMIFDDHEITDDWNISEKWRRRVVSAPFGRAILRNGLMAYAVFQAWGNDPEKFRHDGSPPEAEWHPNEKLLAALTSHVEAIAAPTAATLDKIDALLGLDKPVTNPKVEFSYAVPGPKFKVHVLDTRTRRTYKGAGHAPPKLLGGNLDGQLPKGPFTDGRELLVVVSPVPVLFPRIFESLLQPLAGLAFDLKTHMFGREDLTDPCKVTGLVGSEHKDIEGWRADEDHHEQLLRRLGTYRRVVVLSGDVHFASTLTLDFWGKDDETLDSRIVQCTASAARNQPGDDMRGLLRTLRIGQQLLRGVPAERIAWEGEHGVVLPAGASIRPGRRGRLRRKPVLLPAQGWPAGTTVSKAPDWRWRLEVVRDERPKSALPAGAPEVPVVSWNAGDKLASYAEIGASHQTVTLDPKDPVRLMVFRNNLGLVSFARDGADFRVAHTLLSNVDDETGDAFTEHTVAFAPTPLPAAPVLKAE